MDTLSFLYATVPGRLLLRPLCSSWLSNIAGRFLDSRLSWPLAGVFARKNNIAAEDYLLEDAKSFNDFFSRRIRPGLRPVERDPERFIAPCDGLLRVYPVERGQIFPVKQSAYTLETLLRDRELAARFEGGCCFIYRLCVEHYHRYVYVEDGEKGPDRRIQGVYHTVRPVALENRPVFCENTRIYTVLRTAHMGELLQMEVGAMLVGRIVNEHPGEGAVRRGQEKGCFQYGGSTVLVLTQRGRVTPIPALAAASERGEEFPVRLGEAVGVLNRGQEAAGTEGDTSRPC